MLDAIRAMMGDTRLRVISNTAALLAESLQDADRIAEELRAVVCAKQIAAFGRPGPDHLLPVRHNAADFALVLRTCLERLEASFRKDTT